MITDTRADGTGKGSKRQLPRSGSRMLGRLLDGEAEPVKVKPFEETPGSTAASGADLPLLERSTNAKDCP
jgi:hypothetical protein